MCIYNYFFFKILKNNRIKLILKIGTFLFSLLFLIAILKFDTFQKWEIAYFSKLFSTIGFLLLLVPCICYFLEILKFRSEIDLFQRPTFWITTGIFFFSFISIPYELIDMYFIRAKYEHQKILSVSLFLIPFTLNFLFLTKGFLCRKNLTI
jgi:hypothetical protein